jgi:hypothetical protein
MTPLVTQLASNLQPVVPPAPRASQNVHELFTINIPLPAEEGEDYEEEEEAIPNINTTAQALLNLFNLPNRRLLRTNDLVSGPSLFDAFMQPVVVRPTPEQITQYTMLGNLISDTEHTCAICQEVLQADQEGRKLNACGHWFHRSCIDTWFQRDVHCPVCRHDIREPARQASRRPSSEQPMNQVE